VGAGRQKIVDAACGERGGTDFVSLQEQRQLDKEDGCSLAERGATHAGEGGAGGASARKAVDAARFRALRAVPPPGGGARRRRRRASLQRSQRSQRWQRAVPRVLAAFAPPCSSPLPPQSQR